MDCVIPGNCVRPFCAAIGCLSRVGKDIIFDFDPLDGLTLCGLSDSKAVFAAFHYEPTFFQSCTCPPSRTLPRKRKSTGSIASVLDGNDGSSRWCVRVSIKALAAVVKPRKDVVSLQLVTKGDLLSFAFKLQRPDGYVTRVVHKVGISIAQSVAAVASMDTASELVVQPSVILTMLEPLRRSAEMALLINETHKVVSSVSFAHDDISQELSLQSIRTSTLKTETSLGYDELTELNYVAHPQLSDNELIPPPQNLKEQVMLVFTIKEFKAILQFCAHSHFDQELPVTMQFHWGGKPMVVRTQSTGFSAQLVMATLDHNLLHGATIKAATPSGHTNP